MKKAELTTQQIVMLIVLILSFAVILTLLFRLNPGDITDKEICHNSVVLQGKSSGLSGAVDCKIDTICISGGEECDQFNEKRKIPVDLKGNVEYQIKKIITEEMADCWWMFGEGEIPYVGNGPENLKNDYHCAICSQIKFDSSIRGIVEKITYKELYDHLYENKIDKSETYLRYLYGINDIKHLDNFKPKHQINLGSDSFIETSKKYSIFTGMRYDFASANEYIHPLIVETNKEGKLSPCDLFGVSSY